MQICHYSCDPSARLCQPTFLVIPWRRDSLLPRSGGARNPFATFATIDFSPEADARAGETARRHTYTPRLRRSLFQRASPVRPPSSCLTSRASPRPAHATREPSPRERLSVSERATRLLARERASFTLVFLEKAPGAMSHPARKKSFGNRPPACRFGAKGVHCCRAKALPYNAE